VVVGLVLCWGRKLDNTSLSNSIAAIRCRKYRSKFSCVNNNSDDDKDDDDGIENDNDDDDNDTSGVVSSSAFFVFSSFFFSIVLVAFTFTSSRSVTI
jgi:hypothetical protein